MMSKLSPVHDLVTTQNINVNPLSQKSLLKYAASNKQRDNAGCDSDVSDDDQDYSKFVSKANSKKEK